MRDLLLAFAVPLGVSLVMTRVMRGLALRCQALDRPDGWRKLHKRPVPLWGGVAVYLALLVGVLVVRKIPVAEEAQIDRLSTALLASTTLIFLLGFLDDRYDLRGRLKLLLQFVSVTPIVAAGYWYDQIGLFNHTVHIGWLGVPFAMFWLVGTINALNLLDGMDGNASTVGAIACAAVAAISYQHGLNDVSLVALAMAGAIVGFLFYNLPSASIYLGDAGSTVIGLVVGFLSLQGARDAQGALRITAPLIVLTVPILDCTLAIVRRKLAGRRFDHADRGHIHHRLLDRGFNAWQALAITGSLCFVSGAAAIAATYFDNEPLAWLTAVVLIFALAQLRYFGHHEYVLARRFATAMREAMFDQLLFRRHRARWQAHAGLPRWTFDEAWDTLTRAVQYWPVERIELCVWQHDRPITTRRWLHESADEEATNHWRLALTFGPLREARCELLVVGRDRQTTEPRYLAHLASVLRVYGRYWLHHPEQVTANEITAAPQIEVHAAPAVRQAA
ncbi:MAG: undecaprenyl/decaprenyl-phosphate alpha-N-acetylglucosaminyl 1-phosphate transferase [Planctomycetaceae bacterium]|nr:undecaprenyl/decaprenyl-phosphate alpha-N-acetylglucosaminyl 1-phosphate transferase [Planctomycetaceae bacterium]